MDRNELGAAFICFAYNFGILAGCAYLVEAHDWSPWWFLVAALALKTIRTGKAAETD